MSETTKYKSIEPNQCPRCGGHNTELSECEDSIERRICHDCAAKEPDGDSSYEVVYAPLLASVEWWTDGWQVQHEVQDADYQAACIAGKLRDELDWIVQFIETHPEWDRQCFRRGGAAHARSAWFDRVKFLLTLAKGQNDD